MTISRAPEADITIDDEWASRIHAIIEWDDEVIRIDDNGSTNGIYATTAGWTPRFWHKARPFARYGGEEFVIIPCGQIHMDEVFGFCERLRRAIESSEFRFGDTCIQITASFGFHTCKISKNKKIDPQLADMIKKTDQAFYNALHKA